MRALLLTLTTCLFVLPAHAKYSGGTGEPNDPYQIATAADLILLGDSPADYGKNFVMTADIDLDPNLPGGKVFDKAVIAPSGSVFTGVFHGNGHVLSHLTVQGKDWLGLFGQLGDWPSICAEVKDLGVVDVNIVGSGYGVGGLVGINAGGTVTRCYSSGSVSGDWHIGGLVGENHDGTLIHCYSTGSVSGTRHNIGGLVGRNLGTVSQCYSVGVVSGYGEVGGLVGSNGSDYIEGVMVTDCYSTGPVSGTTFLGGLVGYNACDVDHCYSTGTVNGQKNAGGLVGGSSYGSDVTGCFWDAQTSGPTWSAGGTGVTTAEMLDIRTYLNAGWDFAGETENGLHEIWRIPEGSGYPVLAVPHQLEGLGTPENPYLISDALDLGAMVHYSLRVHYQLAASIDLSGICWRRAVIPWFQGSFDGNNLTISQATIQGRSDVGLFGRLGTRAEVKNLGVVDVNITGSGDFVGGLAGDNWDGAVIDCYSSGVVSGSGYCVGGLVGRNDYGTLTHCYSTSTVSGVGQWSDSVGGLVGGNKTGSVTQSYSTGAVSGYQTVGGLVGESGNYAPNEGGTEGACITECYSTGPVTGGNVVGGLLGRNETGASVTNCYSTGTVSGTAEWSFLSGLVGMNGGTVTNCYGIGAVSGTGQYVGGLVGNNGGFQWSGGPVMNCFWDTQTSGQATSAGGTGKTTAEMQTASTFLEAGWDFVGETVNGTEDIWWILEGKDYPRLAWEQGDGASP